MVSMCVTKATEELISKLFLERSPNSYCCLDKAINTKGAEVFTTKKIVGYGNHNNVTISYGSTSLEFANSV